MSEYKYHDGNVREAVNQCMNGNADVEEVWFKEPTTSIFIHKQDVIHLARGFGLVVYEKNSSLGG